MNKSDCHHVGTLIKLYGYKGAYVLALGSYFGEEIQKWESVFIEIDGLLVPFFIDKLDLTGETTAIITFEELPSETLAKKYLNCNVYQLTELITIEDQLDVNQLSGYNVIDKTIGSIGTVAEILNYKQNLLLRVVKGKKEILVPIAENIIVKVNHKKKEILIAAPEGLFELN